MEEEKLDENITVDEIAKAAEELDQKNEEELTASEESIQQAEEELTLNESIQEEQIEELEEEPKKEERPKKGKKKLIIIGIIILLIIGIGGGVFFYLNNNKNKEVTTKKEYKSEYRMSGNELEDFDLKFLQIETNNKNIIYSPLSIKYALAMLKEGSKGDSKSQIEAVIGDYKAKKYNNNEHMSFANAMFIKNTFKDAVKKEYTDTLKEKYNAEVIYDAFDNPNNINSWVSDKTFKLINNLVDRVEENDFFLINALAIDMEWNKKIQATTQSYKDMYSVSYPHEEYGHYIEPVGDNAFYSIKFKNNIQAQAGEIGASINNYDLVNDLGEENVRNLITKEYTEWLKKGECDHDPTEANDTAAISKYVDNFIKEVNANYKRVDTSTDFKFYYDEEYKIFNKELKTYEGTTLEYIGIMPRKEDLGEFIKNSDAKSINELISKTHPVDLENSETGKITKITGGIPFFKYNYNLNLINDLKELGIKDVFTKKADLNGIVENSTEVIDKAMHAANIEFSNDGIKAAAATALGGLGSTSCGYDHIFKVPVVIIDLSFDNPYMYIIRDIDTKEVWFVGSVYEPTINPNKYARVINEKEQ